MKVKKYLASILFILSIGFGVIISIDKYYHSPFQFVYWIFCGLLLIAFRVSKVYNAAIGNRQYFTFLLTALICIAGWLIVPHFWRFGVYPFAILCLLYSGIILYDNGKRLIRVLFIAAFMLSAVNIIPVLFYFSERSLITRPLIDALLASNPEESKEYIADKFSIAQILLVVFFIGITIIMLIKRDKSKSAPKPNMALYIVFFVSFALTIFSGTIGAFSSEYAIYLKQRALLKNMVEERKRGNYMNTFSVKGSDSSAKKVMIIVGESLNRRFMSLYGYPKNTTPNLLRLSSDSSKGKLYPFTNIISPETTTFIAIRKVLSNINNENNIPFDKSVTIVDLFKKAGYQSFWISNQAPLGSYEAPISIIALNADHVYFTAQKKHIVSNNVITGGYYDGELLDAFNNFESKADTRKQVFFIHLMGSHWNYPDRYPASFNVFHDGNVNQSTYLNTIYYNDYIVSHLIQLAQQNKFDVVCYFSDHGEDMNYAHNSENYTPDMSTIPFMVYLSNQYRAKHQDLDRNLKKNKDIKGMTDNFFQDIQLLSGFKSSMLNPAEAFVSDKYVFKKRSVVDNSIPFDK